MTCHQIVAFPDHCAKSDSRTKDVTFSVTPDRLFYTAKHVLLLTKTATLGDLYASFAGFLYSILVFQFCRATFTQPKARDVAPSSILKTGHLCTSSVPT